MQTDLPITNFRLLRLLSTAKVSAPLFPAHCPRRAPAISTPNKRSGSICFAKVHDDSNQWPLSPLLVLVITEIPITPTVKAIMGLLGIAIAATAVGIAAKRIFHHFSSNHNASTTASAAANMPVIIHFTE